MSTSTQSNVLYSNEIFKQYLMQLSSGIVWKNSAKAIENESTDLTDIYLAELFVIANRGLLNFDIVKSFPRSVLRKTFNESDAEIYAADKRKIPIYERDRVVSNYAEALAARDAETGYPILYTEQNNYYRMLMGLPNKEDNDYIYNTDIDVIKMKNAGIEVNEKIPIHQMSLIDRIKMENAGILNDLLSKNPTKEYLFYMGKNSIDPFNARIADKFEILNQITCPSDTLTRDFKDAYSTARRMVMSVYYNNSIRKSNELYENFLAMCVLFITIQSMQHKYLQVDITRDFYDTESLKLVYDSYGVPFYTEIPLEYHRKIVKNINKLISYKGSSKVFFDLFDIFDVSNIDVYQYFLTKTHIMDSEGNPSFIIQKDDEGNDMYDDNGNPILSEENYKIKFSKVKIYDDPVLSIADSSNNISYETITEPDPYWINDPELISKLNGEKFNYMESKYIGIQTIFDLMKITYENAYIFRMITDNKDITDAMTFRWSDLNITCSIFDIFIYLSCLYCRYYGYEGIINTKIPAIMDTLGYNFENDVKVILNSINNTELKLLISSLEITNIDSINNAYSNIERIRELIINGFTNAKSLNEYNAYRELYDALMVSKEIESVYTKNNGEIYETFEEVLQDTSSELAQRYLLMFNSDENIDIDKSAIKDEIIITINQIESMLYNLKYLHLSTGFGASAMIDSLFRILTFFKSAKVELTGYDITYVISMRGINFFKMMDLMKGYVTSSKLNNDSMGIKSIKNNNAYVYNKSNFIDMIRILYETIKYHRDIIEIRDNFKNDWNINYINYCINKLSDEIVVYSQIIEDIFKDEVWYIDFIQSIQHITNIRSSMLIKDSPDGVLTYLDIIDVRYKEFFEDQIITLTDKIKSSNTNPTLHYLVDAIQLIDAIHLHIEEICDKSKNILLTLFDSIKSEKCSGISIESNLILRDFINLFTDIKNIKDNSNPSNNFKDNICKDFLNQVFDDYNMNLDFITNILSINFDKYTISTFSDNLYEIDSNGSIITVS